MSLLHLAQQLSVKRDYIPPIGFVDDLDIFTARNVTSTKQSQQDLNISNRYRVISERHKKKLQQNHEYYLRNAQRITQKQREIYRNCPNVRAKKLEKNKLWQQKNRLIQNRASATWRQRHNDRSKEISRRYFEKLRENLTPEEYKAWHRARNQRAKENRIAKIGFEEYRKIERERHKNRRKNLSPEKLAIEKEKARIRQQRHMERIKSSPELLAAYREKQAQHQRNIREKRKLEKEQP